MIEIFNHHHSLVAFPRMHDQLTVKAVNCDVRCFMGYSKSIEKLWRSQDNCSAAIDECSYSLQFSILIIYLDLVDNVG
jgi:hypothetical protein